jgi:hypothetical protein
LDFRFGDTPETRFEPVKVDGTFRHSDTIALGGTVVTAHDVARTHKPVVRCQRTPPRRAGPSRPKFENGNSSNNPTSQEVK